MYAANVNERSKTENLLNAYIKAFPELHILPFLFRYRATRLSDRVFLFCFFFRNATFLAMFLS